MFFRKIVKDVADSIKSYRTTSGVTVYPNPDQVMSQELMKKLALRAALDDSHDDVPVYPTGTYPGKK